MIRVLTLLLTALLLLSACNSLHAPPAKEVAGGGAPAPIEQTPKPEPQPQPEPVKPAITAMTISGGTAWDDEWTLVPWGPVQVTVSATGVTEMSLTVARYATGHSPDPFGPKACSEGTCTFVVSEEMLSGQRLFQVEAVTPKGERLREQRLVFAIPPERREFTTIAQGRGTGWSQQQAAEVEELFQEARILWFEDSEQLAAFGARLKSLLGEEIPVADLNGRIAIAVLGAPGATRPFEVVSLMKTPGSWPLVLGMRHKAVTKTTDQPGVSYHIIAFEMPELQRPAQVTVSVQDALSGNPLAEHTVQVGH